MKHTQVARYTAVTIGFLYSVALYASGLKLDSAWKHVLAFAPAAAALLFTVFDKWLWRVGPLPKWLGHPRIDGTWRVVLQPHEDSHIPEGGNRGPIEALLVIEQTFTTVSVSMWTQESGSRSTAAALRRDPGHASRYVFSYTFTNEPKMEVRPRSDRHIGASEFDVVGVQPKLIEGTYWTDRFTVGAMTCSFVSRSTSLETSNLGQASSAIGPSSESTDET